MDHNTCLHLASAGAGALIGSLRSALTRKPHKSFIQCLTDILTGTVAGGSLAAYSTEDLTITLAIGVGLGTISCYTLDTIYDSVPQAIKNLIEKWTKK